jgi:hypothetical protein
VYEKLVFCLTLWAESRKQRNREARRERGLDCLGVIGYPKPRHSYLPLVSFSVHQCTGPLASGASAYAVLDGLPWFEVGPYSFRPNVLAEILLSPIITPPASKEEPC